MAPTGGAAVGDSAYYSSGGVHGTVNPKDTILPSESNMLHKTITLSSDQTKLVAEEAKALDNESTEEAKALDNESTEPTLKLLSDSGRKLFGSLERKIRETLQSYYRAPPGPLPTLIRAMKLPRGSQFDVVRADVFVAILLADSKVNPDADSEAVHDVKIISDLSLEYSWPENTACILPRGWTLRSEGKDCYLAVMPVYFGGQKENDKKS